MFLNEEDKYRLIFREQVEVTVFYPFYPLSFSPKGERFGPLLPPWGKVGKGY
jgi:hypothetical protein